MRWFGNNSSQAEEAGHRAEEAASNSVALLSGAGATAIGALDQIHISAVKPYICCGTCCYLTALGIDYPRCLGCSTQGTFCGSLEYGSATCKPVKKKPVNCVCQSSFCVFTDAGKDICVHQ